MIGGIKPNCSAADTCNFKETVIVKQLLQIIHEETAKKKVDLRC